MARPLRYEDSFMNIINEKIHDKFLKLFTIKVQSTAFCQKLNLQRSLMIASLFDITLGFIISISFFHSIQVSYDSFLYFIENFILMIGICFGLVGLDTALNLKKSNSMLYKRWRIFITFAFPFLELINNFNFFCNYKESCNKFTSFLFVIVLFAINMYLTRIAWSFYIRLLRSHELLIIHGKYLERMIDEESYKIRDVKKYVPPESPIGLKPIPINNTVAENELNVFGNISNKTSPNPTQK
jgi:hypothetical protein